MSRTTRWFLTLSVALVALFATFGSAAAAPGAGDPPPDGARLERAYREEQLRLAGMERRFQEAKTFAATVAAMIPELKQHGVDTTRLERALVVFRNRMAEARRQWEVARDTLAAHAGFDAAGHVTDVAKAGATVAKAHTNLLQAHALGELAFRELRAVVASYVRPRQ